MTTRHLVVCGMLVAGTAAAQSPPSLMLQAMQHELNRNLTALRTQPVAPYFLSYEVSEVNAIMIRSSFGAITENDQHRMRALVVDLRVGTPRLDNTHALPGGFPDFGDIMDFSPSCPHPTA